MQEPRLDFVTCSSPAGLHRMAYWEWGDPNNDQVVVCVHGLTRTGRDFDRLAQRLASRYRVVCPDVVGRGSSDWLANPNFYVIPQYASDMLTLLARIQAKQLYWVGTSMGGLIGLALNGALKMATLGLSMRPQAFSIPLNQGITIHKMVLNDVGPRLDSPALARIGHYVGQAAEFDSFQSAVNAVRQVAETFGQHTDEQWAELTRYVYPQRNGRWVKHYDLGIAVPLSTQTPMELQAGEQILWQSYDALQCPTLIIRGSMSDLLSARTVSEMLLRNPQAQVHEVPNVGHAPTLMVDDQINPLVQFLN